MAGEHRPGASEPTPNVFSRVHRDPRDPRLPPVKLFNQPGDALVIGSSAITILGAPTLPNTGDQQPVATLNIQPPGSNEQLGYGGAFISVYPVPESGGIRGALDGAFSGLDMSGSYALYAHQPTTQRLTVSLVQPGSDALFGSGDTTLPTAELVDGQYQPSGTAAIGPYVAPPDLLQIGYGSDRKLRITLGGNLGEGYELAAYSTVGTEWERSTPPGQSGAAGPDPESGWFQPSR